MFSRSYRELGGPVRPLATLSLKIIFNICIWFQILARIIKFAGIFTTYGIVDQSINNPVLSGKLIQ